MAAQESRAKLLSRSAAALELLEEIIDDPKAKARERLNAVRVVKMGLFWLTQLAESQQAPPDLRKGIIETLRRHQCAIRRKQNRRAA